MVVLVGDIGGTHTRLAVSRIGGARPEILRRKDYESRALQGVAEAAVDFLAGVRTEVATACLAVPCPVHEGRCEAPNLPWEIDVDELRSETGLDSLRLINDFQAVGHAIGCLTDADRALLKEGEPEPDGPVAYLGPGTGLGSGFLTRGEGGFRVHGSESGHVDFAPRSDLECRLLLYLTERYGRASCERVVSGPGLVTVYDFLVADGYAKPDPELARRREGEDAAALVTEFAGRGDPVARGALDIFMSALGAQAGNLALTVGATGGVYVAGGIAPGILDALREGPFVSAFGAKGRMRDTLARIPVWVILDDDVGLTGAALFVVARRVPEPSSR